MNISFFGPQWEQSIMVKNKQTTLPLYQIKALECGTSIGIVVYETHT